MIHLNVGNISKCCFLNKDKLKSIVSFILRSEGIRDAGLSIIFTSDAKIKKLNYSYRGKNKPTDVLSFSMREGVRLKKDSSTLGDVVISVDRARKQAKRFNATFKREILLYIIHGILHLLGYDDEDTASRKKMQKRETRILNKISKSPLF